MSSVRTSIERVSLPAVEFLDRLPKAVPFLVVLGFLIAGIVKASLWPLTALAVLLLGWLFYLAWPRLTTPERLLRVAVLVFFVALVVTKAFPRS